MTLPDVPRYIHAPPTEENLDYVDLATIDLSKADTEEGRAALAIEVKEALLSYGCFYVVNHGYSRAQATRMFDIADVTFSGVSDDEKQSYLSTEAKDGAIEGYILLNYTNPDGDVRNKYHRYAINCNVTTGRYPEALRPLLPEVQEFIKHNHLNVVHPISNLIERSLELPEDTLVNLHSFGNTANNSTARFLKYFPRPEEEAAKTKNVWLKGHTDFGSITVLWSQPVAGLQIKTSEGEWRWVRHMEDALVVNTGDAIDFITGGYYKGTVHRVIQPPKDQRDHTRVGIFYFARLDDDVKLVPLAESPILQRAGIQRRWDDSEALTMEQWRMASAKAYFGLELKEGKEKGVEEEVTPINGVVVKDYD